MLGASASTRSAKHLDAAVDLPVGTTVAFGWNKFHRTRILQRAVARIGVNSAATGKVVPIHYNGKSWDVPHSQQHRLGR